jgi:hypothetical protein
VRLVGQPGETPLYISNQKFFPKLNALLEVTDFQKKSKKKVKKLKENY